MGRGEGVGVKIRLKQYVCRVWGLWGLMKMSVEGPGNGKGDTVKCGQVRVRVKA